MSWSELGEQLQAEVEERLFATGGQLYVSVSGEVLQDLAVGVDGLGQQVNEDTLFALYCSGKPAVAVAIAALVEDGEVSLNDQVGDIVAQPMSEALESILVGDILSHTAGLHDFNPYLYMGLSDRKRAELLQACVPPPGWRQGTDVAYAQVLGWHVLGAVVESLVGLDLRTVVRKRVLTPMDAYDFFVGGMSDEEYLLNRERLGVNIFLAGTLSEPVLAELNQRYRCRSDPSFGATGSARGVGRFYEGLLRIAHGDASVLSPELLAQFTSTLSYGFDEVMVRQCGYGYGFMTSLRDHEFGQRCSNDAFGHSAYGGMTAAFCDPRYDLVVAFHFNGRIDAESAIGFWRPSLVGRIYRAVLDDA